MPNKVEVVWFNLLLTS